MSNESSEPKLEAVIQLDTPDQEAWKQVLHQIENLLVEDESASVEVVCSGRGVDLIRRDTTHLSIELNKLAARGVSFVACNNSLHQRSISESELFPFVTIVPSAIGELIRAQRDGKAYLKLT
ncbi:MULTISPECIES: DsrE family protein [Ferrimicrobium]|uniref:DsrE family protein n=1 Tax=Ferrimicrobium acidiphilum TaxID=121039 RepID=A0ABV3Y0Z8_9ACTN|nr:DsrE family protein [Ferrimicrobium sp.]